MDILSSIKNKDFELFKTLVNSTTNLEAVRLDIGYSFGNRVLYEKNIPVLHLLASLDYIDFFRYLHQEKNMSLKQEDEHQYLPLHLACYSGSTEVVLYILKEDPEEALYKPVGSQIPLLYLACHQKVEIVKELLSAGAKITDPWIDEFILLNKAKNHPDILSFLVSQCSPNAFVNKNGITLLMKCIIDNSPVESMEIAYRGIEDLKAHFYDRSGYHSIFTDATNYSSYLDRIKDFLLKIIDDAIKFDVSIEPTANNEHPLNAGACHWMCSYCDLDVAKKIVKTKDFDINRFDKDYKLGPERLIENRSRNVVPLLTFMIENGLDVNKRYDQKSPTLLESFVTAIRKNYGAIEVLLKYGADVNALHSKQTDRNGNPTTLANFVKERGDPKMKKIFNDAV